PHGIWPSGDGSRVYVALENGEHCVAIDTVTNKVIATIPIGQTPSTPRSPQRVRSALFISPHYRSTGPRNEPADSALHY
ncbi:MAG: hypothetical protein WCB20_09005, partial [Chthoniobacterales bacterium]